MHRDWQITGSYYNYVLDYCFIMSMCWPTYVRARDLDATTAMHVARLEDRSSSRIQGIPFAVLRRVPLCDGQQQRSFVLKTLAFITAPFKFRFCVD
jgi:hypothetical protein